jgi:hypothetical protein
MAFSFEPDGGIAVARILSDHPEDNGKLVYLHVNYAPALDDAWYDQTNDPYEAAIPQDEAKKRKGRGGSKPGHSAHPRGGTSIISRRRTHKGPQTTPSSNITTTQEVADADFAFPAAVQPSSGSSSSGTLLRGGAFGDEEEPTAHGQSLGAASGPASAAPGSVPPLPEGPGLHSFRAEQMPPPAPRSILKRRRIEFDPLDCKDEKGEHVPPRRKQRLEEHKYKFPRPAKDPDDMTDDEFDKWTDTMTDEEFDEFERYMDDMDIDSDSEVEIIDREPRTPPPSPRLPPPIRPIATKPGINSTNPVDLLGADYFQVGSRERGQIKEKELKQMAAQLAYGPRHIPNYTGPKAAVMTKVHDEAIRDTERRQMGKEIELFGGDCFRLIPSWPKRECMFVVGQQGAGEICCLRWHRLLLRSTLIVYGAQVNRGSPVATSASGKSSTPKARSSFSVKWPRTRSSTSVASHAS